MTDAGDDRLFDIPAFLRRAPGRVPFRPRQRRIRVEPLAEQLGERWQRAAEAVCDIFPPAFPEDFPSGRRRVRFIERPRKGTVRVRVHGHGDIAEIDAKAFHRCVVSRP